MSNNIGPSTSIGGACENTLHIRNGSEIIKSYAMLVTKSTENSSFLKPLHPDLYPCCGEERMCAALGWCFAVPRLDMLWMTDPGEGLGSLLIGVIPAGSYISCSCIVWLRVCLTAWRDSCLEISGVGIGQDLLLNSQWSPFSET